MTKNTSVSLGEDYQKFIDRQIAKGRFGSASEAIRAGLRLLEERETELEQLRAAIEAGYASGEPEPFDVREFLASKNAQ